MRDLNGPSSFIFFLLLSSICLAQALGADNSLKVGFYKDSCPHAEWIVRETIRRSFAYDPDLPAGLIRLFFHDCFVKGCDASVLLDMTPGGGQVEKASPSSIGLRGLEVIDQAKSILESECPSTVSCADILAFAARDATALAGIAPYPVTAGRRDGTSSHLPDTRSLPSPAADADLLIGTFAAKGFSKVELVVLSGAHSIGGAHCPTFKNRLYNYSGDPWLETQDPSMDSMYAEMLKSRCPKTEFPLFSMFDIGAKVAFDGVSSRTLDSSYYAELVKGKGLLASDQALMNDTKTREWVNEFASDPTTWAKMFGTAMVKLGEVEVLVGDKGEIRSNCRSVN